MEKMSRVDFFSTSNASKRKKKLVSANERLYKAAFSLKERKEKMIQHSEREVEKSLRASKFTMPEGSKKLLTKYRLDGTDSLSVGDRLHGAGLKEKDRKIKLSEAAKKEKERAESLQLADKDRHVNTWSCYKCGTYYTFSSLERKAFDFKKVCKICGVDQSSQKPFKPKNVALENKTTAEVGDDGSSSRVQSDFTTDKKKSSNIHDQLHAYKQIQERKRVQLVCKYLDDEHKVYPFKPCIPSSSEAIVEKLKISDAKLIPVGQKHDYVSETEAWYDQLAGGRVGDRLSTSPKKNHTAVPSISTYQDEAVPFAEYFSMPASDRLFVHGHKNRVERRSQSIGSNSVSTILADDEDYLQRAKSVISKKEFVDRLVYEYHDKNAKIVELQHKYKPSFKPKPTGFSSYLQREVHSHGEFLVDLLRRGHDMKEKRQKAAADTKCAKYSFAGVIPKALPESTRILKEANSKLIEELFSVLISRNGSSLPPQVDQRLVTQSASDRFAGLQVDLALISFVEMVPEVKEILVAVVEAHKSSVKENNMSNTLVSFEEFSQLVLANLCKKKGPGKSYICAPRKKPDVTIKMMLEEEKQLTFKPELCIPAAVLEGR